VGEAAQATSRQEDSPSSGDHSSLALLSSNEAIHDALIVADNQGVILEVNRHTKTFFGAEVNPGDLRVDLREKLSDCFEQTASSQEAYQRLFHSYGRATETLHMIAPEPRELCAFSAPVLDDIGEAFGRLWTFEDRTEQVVLQENLTEAQQMEAVGRLAGGIAHDLNNLLTGVIGNLSLAQMVPTKTIEECGDNLGAAECSAYRASELVKQLLGFSRKNTRSACL
jgi:signal transduction histidine kinase